MSSMRFPVAIVMQRWVLDNPWASERWEAIAVEPDPSGDPPPVECVESNAQGERWCFRGFAIEFERSEAEGYQLNLTSPAAKAFVLWRRRETDEAPPAGGGVVVPAVFPVLVTASYNEAARFLDAGEQVDPVPLPSLVRHWLIPFVAAHYVHEPRRKVRRNDPFVADPGKPPAHE